MGFLSTQSTLLNLSGNSANLSTIQSGSSIVGISLSGSGYTFGNDIPNTWTGSFSDKSFIQLNENEVVVASGSRHAFVYTLETPSGSLSITDDEYVMVAQKRLANEWDEETETTSSFKTDGIFTLNN